MKWCIVICNAQYDVGVCNSEGGEEMAETKSKLTLVLWHWLSTNSDITTELNEDLYGKWQCEAIGMDVLLRLIAQVATYSWNWMDIVSMEKHQLTACPTDQSTKPKAIAYWTDL